jgi:HK97 family phage major capsid protein
MPSKVYQIGRLNADVAPAYKTEGSAINVSDPGFDFVQLTATTLGSLTVASLEFLADAPNADTVLQEAIGKAMALEIDKAILFGQLLTADGSEGYNLPTPYPRGVLKTLLALASGQVLGNATNGTVQTAASFFRELQSLVFSVKRRNETPGALVSNDALYQKYVDAYDTQNRPLPLPSNLADMPWLTTNAIASATQGTGTTMTDVFCGDWSQVLLGQRLGIEIRVLTERYAELGQVGILAYSRNDVQLARLSAMGVYRYLQAAV